jgi:hypothetical protein
MIVYYRADAGAQTILEIKEIGGGDQHASAKHENSNIIRRLL